MPSLPRQFYSSFKAQRDKSRKDSPFEAPIYQTRLNSLPPFGEEILPSPPPASIFSSLFFHARIIRTGGRFPRFATETLGRLRIQKGECGIGRYGGSHRFTALLFASTLQNQKWFFYNWSCDRRQNVYGQTWTFWWSFQTASDRVGKKEKWSAVIGEYPFISEFSLVFAREYGDLVYNVNPYKAVTVI